MHTSPVTMDSIHPGQSRIGGIPDLPVGFEWPRFKGRSLSFIAQLDLAEITRQTTVLSLPAQGSLCFFYDSEQRTWGFDPEDRGSARVAYFPEDVTKLNRVQVPDDVSG